MCGFNPYEVRRDFPALERRLHGRRLVYLDSAATSLKPRCVIEAIASFYRERCGNVARGVHTLSQEVTRLYEDAREEVARFIGADGDEVVFTYGATDSLNLAAYGWGLRNLREGDEVVLTVMEHHSNVLPWQELASLKGVRLRYVGVTGDGRLDYAELEGAISERTRVVAITHMSNVLGTINDVRRVARAAHSVGAIVVVDGAQSVPHMKVDVRALEADFLAFSGHKMLGPMGIGVLWCRRDVMEEMAPHRVGGGAIVDVEPNAAVYAPPPRRFEAGTPNVEGAVGLMEAVRYLARVGMESVEEHERELTRYAMKLFEEELGDAVEVYGPRDVNARGGILSFNLRGLDHDVVGMALDSCGIAVRTGMHCAHILHKRLGLRGTVRASFYLYNVREDVEALVDACAEIAQSGRT
ncbi:cysteine desulfurase [Candidatus Geothermarchaeota archaeon ex4572_27]|nr:MAG: cysteine desulfurase [Candidatus Geothermarchaeota archaeon ex4572_27]